MMILLLCLLLLGTCFGSEPVLSEREPGSSDLPDTQVPEGKAPNVVFIIADDLGWNDVGYHGSELKSPVIYMSVRYVSW